MTVTVRRLTGVVIAAALIAAMVLVTAEPAKTAINTTVTFKVTDKTVKPNQKVLFFGKVKSKKAKCEKKRKVVLKQVGEGKIDSKKTDAEGEYSFKHDPEPDLSSYFVKVKKKKIKVGGGYGYYGYGEKKKKKCKAVESKIIDIRPR
jgi:hypothetical protein